MAPQMSIDEDISGRQGPGRLERICLEFVAKNLEKTICSGSVESGLTMRDHVSLPHALTDPILQYLVDSIKLETLQPEPKSKRLVAYLRAFTDPKKCTLRSVKLRRAPISDDVVQAFCDLCTAHGMTEIDLTSCSDMNGNEKDDTPPYNHSILLPGFIINLAGNTLQRLILHHTMLAYSINQIATYTGRKARKNLVFQSKARLGCIPLCISGENAPKLSALDLSDAFLGWFFTIDPNNPPPLKTLDFDGYHDQRVNSMIKELLDEVIEGEAAYHESWEKPPTGRPTVAYSKSETKLQKYDFFKFIEANEPMRTQYLKASNLQTHLEEVSKIQEDTTAYRVPDHNFNLRQMNVTSMKSTLQHLSLYNTWLSKIDMEEVVFNLKGLKHLDIGWPTKDPKTSNRFRPEEFTIWMILENLPDLVHLDISGTMYGEKMWEEANVENEMMQRRSLNVMLPDRKPLEFLGLWGTKARKLEGLEKLALKTTGDKTEGQLLSCLEMYIDRQEVVLDALTKLAEYQQTSSCRMPNLTLKLCLQCVDRYPHHSSLLFQVAANFFFVTQADTSFLSKSQSEEIANALVRMIEKNRTNNMLVRNSMITFFNFELPTIFLHDFQHMAKLFIELFDLRRNEHEVGFIAGNLCNALVCSLDVERKTSVKDLPFVSTMLSVVRERLRTGNSDEVLDTAWGALWNVSDESPINSEDLIKKGALDLFLQCLEKFPDQSDLKRNMMGLMGNLSEVKDLQHFLAEEKVLEAIIKLVRSKDAGIEVAYNSCGVLAHILTDNPQLLEKVGIQNVRNEMREVIMSWDVDVDRAINYRNFEPLLHILTFPGEDVAHLWVVWAMHNLTRRDPKYVDLLIKDGGVALLKSIRQTTTNDKVREIAQALIEKCDQQGGSPV